MTASTGPDRVFDVVVRGGTVYDGSGSEPFVADVAVNGDRIAAIGPFDGARAGTMIDATGLAVAPGFINMLSHSYFTLLQDPRSLGELLQGVTTQIFGEGHSMGPLTPEMRTSMSRDAGTGAVDVGWTSLAEYLEHCEAKGVSQNVASYIGATTLRIHAVGQDDRPATAAEMDVMRGLVREEMSAGALGIGSSLIYPPAFYAPTEELIELCRAAEPYRGKYISHMRSEADGLLDTGLGELLRISREAGVPAEVYHLKAAGQDNWHKNEQAIAMIEDARARGERITADMYPYTAGATGLSNSIPPSFHDGGPGKLLERLEEAGVRRKIRDAIAGVTMAGEWENLYQGSGAEGVLILGVRKDENRRFQGSTLADIAEELGMDAIDAIIELVRRDRSRIDTAYFMISEENVRRNVQLPWVSFGSDASSMAAEGAFARRSTHPRAYGCFARVLGKYVREEGLVTLPEAIRRLGPLPADNLELDRRGRIQEGNFADLVVFDPQTIADRATYEEPHQYATGVRDVIVNGAIAVRDGCFTGALAGRALYGPGKR